VEGGLVLAVARVITVWMYSPNRLKSLRLLREMLVWRHRLTEGDGEIDSWRGGGGANACCWNKH
jgi:hypothetical protein